MAYTPINWQTGDTITAEKLNRCDNGWAVENTQLFSETVTTADQDGMNMGTLAYGSQIDAPTLVVTFDGTTYTCDMIDNGDGSCVYGGVGEEGPDFTDYPFAILSDVSTGGSNFIYTETAGTHTIAVVSDSVVVSDNFSSAVNACVDASALPMRCIHGVTTYDEMLSAKEAGRLLYFYAGSNMHIIVYFSETESETAVQALPAGIENIETYGFVDIDGTLVFNVFQY